MQVKINPLPNCFAMPQYATEGSAGMDLYAAIHEELEHVLRPGERGLIPTGITIALPKGYEAQIRPRSGLAHKHGVTVCNSPGTLDADFRGQIMVLLINHGPEPFVIKRGDRIAQMVIAPYAKVEWFETDGLDETERGQGGFGSTGK